MVGNDTERIPFYFDSRFPGQEVELLPEQISYSPYNPVNYSSAPAPLDTGYEGFPIDPLAKEARYSFFNVLRAKVDQERDILREQEQRVRKEDLFVCPLLSISIYSLFPSFFFS